MCQLPDGSDSDSKVDFARSHVNKLRQLWEKLSNPVQAKSAETYITDLSGFVDPMANPAGYRLCQDEATQAGALDVLLCIVRDGQQDSLRTKSLECLARLCFGNAGTADMLASSPDFLPALANATRLGAVPPETLSALQLAQAIAASSGDSARAAVPRLIAEALPFLSDNDKFEQLSQATLDLLVSCSFSSPAEVRAALGWEQLAGLLADDESRPSWLPLGPLEVLICGFLAINWVSASDWAGEPHASEVCQNLQAGSFLDHFVECLQSAVKRCAWPENSSAFHSPQRLAEVARKIAGLGFRRQLMPALGSLVEIVEISAGDDAQNTALLALRDICADAHCLQSMLALEDFRRGTLEALHRTGQAPAATDLIAYLEFVENAFMAGQSAKDQQQADCPNAPTVLQLAELFGNSAPLDGKMLLSHLPQICAQVPLAPLATVQTSLGTYSDDGLSLQSFLERVYGTPTILGWWPSLMEDAAQAAARSPLLPGGLSRAAAVFEEAAEGRATVTIQAIHDLVLPALGVQTESIAVEIKFSELNGSAPLSFVAFVRWLSELFLDIAAAEAEAAAEACES